MNKIINKIKKQAEKKSLKKNLYPDWMFKKEDGEEELEKFISKVDADTDEIDELRNDSNVKYILSALKRFANRILSKDIRSLEKAAEEYNKILNMSDVKKIMSRNTNPDSNGGKIKSFINNLEYIIFGSNSRFHNALESSKLDIATGGKDKGISMAPTTARIKSPPRAEQAEESVKKIEKLLKNDSKKQQATEGLKIMIPNQLLTRLPILLDQNKQETVKNQTMK